MLRRERYTGLLIYGKTREVTKKGHAKNVQEGEWVTKEKPELRIVPQELFDAVQARFAKQRHSRGNPTRRLGKAGESRWLLSRIARCAECDAAMTIVSGGN